MKTVDELIAKLCKIGRDDCVEKIRSAKVRQGDKSKETRQQPDTAVSRDVKSGVSSIRSEIAGGEAT